MIYDCTLRRISAGRGTKIMHQGLCRNLVPHGVCRLQHPVLATDAA